MILVTPTYLLQRSDPNKSETIQQDNSSKIEIENPVIGTRPFQEIYISPQELKDFLKLEVVKYGLNYEEIYSVAMAESGFNLNAYNEAGKSYGVFQFIPSTFKAYCEGYYLNPFHQITCACQMFAKGLQFHWDAFCLQNVGNKNCQKRGFK